MSINYNQLLIGALVFATRIEGDKGSIGDPTDTWRAQESTDEIRDRYMSKTRAHLQIAIT